MAEIHLSAEGLAFVEEQVRLRNYKDADAVVAAGLRLLGSKAGKLVELQQLIQEGLDDVEAGRVHEYASGEDMLSDLKRMAAERRKKTGTGH